MMRIKVSSLLQYLRSVIGPGVKEVYVTTLRGETYREEVKGYGYGEPLMLHVRMEDGTERRLVLNTVRPGEFGHEFVWDRAAMAIFSYMTYNRLPRHVRAVGLGYLTEDGEAVPVKGLGEFFYVTEYAEGTEYHNDLRRIAEEGRLREMDVRRARALAEYIADVHSVKRRDDKLYRRRIRELIGHGEALMGLVDSYRGDEDFLEKDELKRIEMKCVEWRWRLRDKGYRLCRVHGDFHPWNVKFTRDVEFVVLDRSRGEWGEAADDLTAMSINYMFFSLMHYGDYREPFRRLFEEFIGRYLDVTGDEEVLRVVQPFYAWRGLVIASPIWYPTLPRQVRRKIFNFIHNVLDSDVFDYRNLEQYLKG